LFCDVSRSRRRAVSSADLHIPSATPPGRLP
jgi:hypothetical protein